jgi:redox-sensitive bicupin YhaK (pirin superfamily)
MDGTFEHADSHGGGGVITNGDTQWMTADGGLLHVEQPPQSLVLSGGLFHGLQLRVNLPKADKWLEPKYQDLRAASRRCSLRRRSADPRDRRGAGRARGPGLDLHADGDDARHRGARSHRSAALAA